MSEPGSAGISRLTCPAHAFPCGVPGSYPPETGTGGLCTPLEVCLDERPVGFPEFHCFWSDNTRVTRRPPPAVCPRDVNAVTPFCGGACALTDCPNRPCLGLSDTRGFGICTSFGPPMSGFASPDLQHWRVRFLDDCRMETGVTCAYLVPVPQPSGLPFGWTVAAEACRVYRAVYPDHVQCRDADWNPIP